jgi:two-component system phosphate regulon sensor histidine kinase PhoR
MRYATSTYLVLASVLAMAVLIAIQVAWLRQSEQLIEEQFQTNVNTALCSTVQTLAQQEDAQAPFGQACVPSVVECGEELNELIKTDLFAQTLSSTLAGFNINLPYEARVCAKAPDTLQEASAELPPYSCALDPITQTDSHFLNLEFAGRKKYMLNKMGMMTGASFGILLLICLLFFYATYRLLREQKMSDLNREFFNHMAHEFRTPLTNIKLASSLLARKDLVPAGKPHLNIIQSEATQLMQQVEQVLYLARLEKNDYLLRKENCDVVELFQSTVTAMDLQVAKQNANIHFTPPPDFPTIQVDSLHLQNALRNLLDNALKYAGEDAEIRIDLKESGDRILFSVSDNGPGLSALQQEQIFTPFYRQQTSRNNCKGFGLGLAYVKRIVDLHKGQINVMSTEGQGTRFEINLPKS